MSLEVQCGQCDARFTLPDDLYERKVKGRIVTVRCKKCRADISVDGTESGTVLDPTPTDQMPISLPPVAGLWVVSFGDEDDRELTVGQIKKALEAGEINHETLVWNTSLDEWLMLGEAPTLKDLVDGDDVGGFLGTGVDIGADVDLAGGDEVGPFRSVGAGTMSDHPEGEARRAEKSASPPPVDGTPTVPLVMPSAKASKDEVARPPKPPRKLPDAPPKIRPAWLSEEEVKKAIPKTEDPDLPEGEEESPSSGTPDLRTLMTESLVPPKNDAPKKDDSASEEIFAIGGGGIAAALPTIDLTSIPPPDSEPRASKKPRKSRDDEQDDDDDDDESPPSSDRPRTKSRASDPKPKKHDRDGARARPAAAPEESKSDSSTIWILLAAVGALAIYWFVIRTPEKPATEGATPTATAQLAPLPVATTSPVATVTPPADAASSEQRDAAAKPTSTNEDKPTDPKETKPVDPKETKPDDPKETKPTEPKETKPVASATGGDVAMAAPFDANAARAALASAAGAASGCRKEGDPAGTATVVVTFAPSGRVTSANISGPPFAGTQTGGCIAGAMRQAKVPAFSGEHVTVSKTVVVQ